MPSTPQTSFVFVEVVMLAIVAAVIGGFLFFWLQQLFKKFEGGATPILIFQFSLGLCVLAIMAFLLPLFL